MAPILGIWASGTTPSKQNSYESIATVNAGGSSTATFSSIPSTYTHLQIRAFSRQTGAVSNASNSLNFNGDSSSSNYAIHRLSGNGSSASADGFATGSFGYIFLSGIAGASDTANVFSGQITDILDYANTNKYKTVRNMSAYDGNGSGAIYFSSGLWLSTAAITTITLTTQSGNFATGSSFALYGIKG
jgi:hypothetical protein